MQIVHLICLLCGILLFASLIGTPVTAAGQAAEDYYNQGIDYASQQQYTHAIASYDNATRINPEYTKAWYNRGNALLYLGLLDDAVVSYDKALGTNMNYTDAWVNRGVALTRLDRFDEALASYDNATRINPEDPDAWYNRGNALLYLDRYEEAIASYDKALMINPGYIDAQQNREVAQKQKNPELSRPTVPQSLLPTPTMTLPPVGQKPTQKVPLMYAPFGAMALWGAYSVWRRQ